MQHINIEMEMIGNVENINNNNNVVLQNINKSKDEDAIMDELKVNLIDKTFNFA